MITNNICNGSDSKRTNKLCAPSTPRIELSRASSSSQQGDSHESSPENVFEQVGTGTLQESIDLNYPEENVLESLELTDELFIQQHKDDQSEFLQKRAQQIVASSLHICKYDENQAYLQQHQRKDSASSEVAALLCISGRSSRISSVCSQGSAISHLSAASGVSRSPSPHRMLLETSFCGPKPVNNLIDENAANLMELSTVTSLEQVLLSRTQDPTQAIIAEGIKVEPLIHEKPSTAPCTTSEDILYKKKTTKNGEKPVQTGITPGHIIIGKTASGTDYIRINLKPHYMYEDRGIAPNEKLIEASDASKYSLKQDQQSKPTSLTLTPKIATDNREVLSSRNMADFNVTPMESKDNRSPSPIVASASRKSSFSSLFRFAGKDSPDPSKERSRTKSKERATSQSGIGTPNKQRSLLTIFKPGKRASSVGSERTMTSPSEVQTENYSRSKLNTPIPKEFDSSAVTMSHGRLRYYDEPIEGVIHIPLHTPPEEKEVQSVFQNIQKLNAKSMKPIIGPITVSDLAVAAAALKPISSRKQERATVTSIKEPRQSNQIQENLDAIHTLSKEYSDSKEVFSKSTMKETEAEAAALSERVIDSTKSSSVQLENLDGEIHSQSKISRLPSVDSTLSVGEIKVMETKAVINSSAMSHGILQAKEKRKLLFATRLGTGSQDEVFCTQFSISKTESISSHMSEEQPLNGITDKKNIIRCTEENGQIIKATSIEENHVNEENFNKRTSTSEDRSETLDNDDKIMMSKTGVSDVNHADVERTITSGSFVDNSNVICTALSEKSIDMLESERNIKTETIKSYTEPQMSVNENEIASLERQQDVPKLTEAPQLPLTHPKVNRKIFSAKCEIPIQPSLDSTSKLETERNVQNRQWPSHITSSVKQGLSENESPNTAIHSQIATKPNPRQSTEETLESSESERNSDALVSVVQESKDAEAVNYAPCEHKRVSLHVYHEDDHESTGLVTQESFEDELPYVPTTLPEEKVQGVSLIPMKERIHMELKTCPLERPRSATPLNPSQLEEYCLIKSEQSTPLTNLNRSTLIRGEKLRISLPKRDSTKVERQSGTSPRKSLKAGEKSWFEFAEQGLRVIGNVELKQPNNQTSAKCVVESKEQVKMKSQTTQRKLSGHWIDFENIPEKRKPPKRITTLPKDSVSIADRLQVKTQTKTTLQKSSTSTDKTENSKILYNYVKPEDCHCECHEIGKESNANSTEVSTAPTPARDIHMIQHCDDTLPLIEREPVEESERTVLPNYNINNECQFSMRLYDITPEFSQSNDTQLSTKNIQFSNK